MLEVTRHLSPVQFFGTEAEFGQISSGFPRLTITTSLFYSQLSIFTEVCQRPYKAANYYVLFLKSGGFISDLGTWTLKPKKTSMRYS